MRASLPQSSKEYKFQRARRRRLSIRAILHVVVLFSLVHVATSSCAFAKSVQLPPNVADMIDVMLIATRSGNIEDLRLALEMSGSAVDLGIPHAADPITALKSASVDGQGYEALAALANLLNVAPATLPLGKDIENNIIYVWPYLAERPLDKLSPAEAVDLYRLAPREKVAEMLEKKRWLWWRLAIGADGSWLLFKKMD